MGGHLEWAARASSSILQSQPQASGGFALRRRYRARRRLGRACSRCVVDSETISNGYNIESPGDTCGLDQTGDQPGVSAVELDLQPLADNGGPTMTHAITTDSAAFNTGGACEVETDQRGVTRPQGPSCDVGAFELEQP